MQNTENKGQNVNTKVITQNTTDHKNTMQNNMQQPDFRKGSANSILVFFFFSTSQFPFRRVPLTQSQSNTEVLIVLL